MDVSKYEMVITVEVADLSGLALDYMVAKVEGHNVGVVSADEQWERFERALRSVETELEPEAYSTIRAAKKTCLCVIESDGHKDINAGSKLNYSTSWAQSGPIIEREGVYLKANNTATEWAAGALSKNSLDKKPGLLFYAKTPLVAAMRCYVASKLGDKVEVPSVLLESQC